MFNLEQAIKEWRKKLHNHPGMEPGYIEELEAHLRDKIDRLISSRGLSEEDAFAEAVGRLEYVEEIAEEFYRARTTSPKNPAWKSRSWIPTLLPNFLKITLRNFQRKKGYAFINIFGLAVGLTVCFLMMLHINFELTFDRFHSKKDRIYRVNTVFKLEDGSTGGRNVTNGWPIGLILDSEYPEIEKVTYIRQWPQYSIKHQNQYYFENTLLADGNFLELFDFELKKGNRSTALSAPRQLVITEEMEKKFFGNESAIGQTLTIEDSVQYTVSGVAENVPDNSHIQFDVLISFASWSSGQPGFHSNSNWLDLNMRNYVLLSEGTNLANLSDKVRDIYMTGAGDYFRELGLRPEVRLEPLTDIYLYSFGNGLGPRSDINYLYLLGGIAVFILIIACINFMNLSTARSIERAKEVGIRKVVGSNKRTLVGQFLTESVLTASLAMILAILLSFWALPWFNNLTQNSFSYSDLVSVKLSLTLLVFIGIVGVLSGLYPAFVLSDFRPVQVLKNSFSTTGRGGSLRKGLVVFQFAISCFLIICTFVVVKQLNFMQSRNLGFEKEQIVVMDIRRAQQISWDPAATGNYQVVKQELLKHPDIRMVSSTLAVPGRNGWRSILAYGERQTVDQRFSIEYLPVDFDYIPMFGLELIAGRTFSEDRTSDLNGGVVINESAVERFGWESPEQALGKHVITINSLLDTPVIGVVKDYHHHGLQEEVQPLVMVVRPGLYQYYALRFNGGSAQDVVDHMRASWNTFFPGYTFEYFFLDEEYAQQYRQERRLAGIYGTFSTFAILIACLGLFGLTAFATAKRTKEIGIRKVLGASAGNIVLLLSREFLMLVGIALCIAAPLAWWFMQDWLSDFAFSTNVGVDIFAYTALASLAITIFTISWQSVKAALMNPVKSLRSE